ncbi:uncharacterized protein LOC123528446 [Mercenaria mercenaria]|uniref:uncharacterized protein LOC123528446 n=1 Tax=Mercenaria mercenaria TaxID=6596 RepID=UPI00234FAA45|nr:uncharacterized protein LOC123528446 [Mercenaria mercenaria]XP_045164096.2 uncharacterized protein LOC123528446 [Mercenaria mercenaria]
MAKKRNRKSTSKRTAAETGEKVINIKNCHTVQIGQTNISTLDNGYDDSASSQVAELSCSKRSGSETCLLVLKNLLKDKEKPVPLENLSECVSEILQKGDSKSFEDLCQMSLKDYLLVHNNDFHVYEEQKTVYVALIKNKRNRNNAQDHDSVSSKISPCATDTASSGGNDWNYVPKKKKKHRQQNGPKSMAREIVSYRTEEDPTVKKFKSLLSTNEDRDILFIPHHKTYAESQGKCMQDIVSMWNTPQRTKSYILIGVEKTDGQLKLNGITKDVDVTFYDTENLFGMELFTMRPTYQCFIVEYDLNRFILLEIASSCGKGQPSIVKSLYDKGGVVLNVNELWYRKGCCNVVCPPTDLTIGSIYQWFLGTTPVVQMEAEPAEVSYRETNTIYSIDEQTATDPEENGSSDATLPEIGKDFTQFWSYVNSFKKNHSYILLSGDVPNEQLNLAKLSLIDWVAVYDFDVFSCSNGLFNAVQDSLESRRHLRIGTWREAPPYPTEDGTYWCFLRGRREISETRTDSPDGLIESPQSWFKVAKPGLIENCEQLAIFSDNYTVFTVVILWPKKEELVPFIKKYLDRLVEILTHTPRIVLCLNEDPVTEMGQLHFKSLCHEYSSNIHICKLSFSKLCLGIGNHISKEEPMHSQCVLPVASSCSYLTPIIPEKDTVWLKEDLEVLYLENPYKKSSDGENIIEYEMMKFYKGGTLHWFARYQKDDDSIDIERDEMKRLEETIQNHIDDYRASVINFFHAPGSGGTTLAQRALWNFHKRIPCAQARAGTFLKSKDLERKLSFLHEKTQLPVLLLIDGEEDSKVKYLCNTLKHTIILHAKQFPWNMQKLGEKYQKDKIYLSGRLSGKEAEKLAAKFGEGCGSTKQKRLYKMRDEIISKKTHHYMYEFGMTVYHHEFKGLVSYVEGYLQLEKNPTEDLLPWQRCLGYLSLVYYYGQTSVPCQFFAALFGKPSDYTMELEKDFPYPTTEFVVCETYERRKNTLRICHYEIAKEILEQLLSRHSSGKSRARSDSLSRCARGNLASLCKEFIEYCNRKKTKDSVYCQTVKHILTKTFIHRDERDRGENEEQDTRKKQQVSPLLLDIPASKPMFTERLQILEKLSSSFPDDPNYHAHVGRFHAFCGPDNEEKAEARFKTAIKLCEKKNKGKQEDELDDSMRSTLMHIYHMYGIVKKRKVSSFTGRSQKDQAKIMSTESEFNNKITELVHTADMSSDFFTKSREMTPDACDFFTNAFNSEIEVRLQICDYIMRHFDTKAEPEKIFKAFLDSSADEDCKYFVEISIQKIERLILECYMDVNLEAEDQTTLRRLVKWYNALFKRQILPAESMTADNEVSDIRLQITSMKIQYGAQNLSMECVFEEDVFNKIIDLYEQMFKLIQSKGIGEKLGKREIEYDYREWIFAIRQDICRKTYSIEEVLIHVQNWHHLVRSPMSTYYLFVLKSLLGFGTDTTPGKTEYLFDAKSLKTELSKKNGLVIRPKYPREWLGSSGDGIRVLQTANRRIGLNENREAGRGLTDLAVCKGTICHPNNSKFGGRIELDLKVSTVSVFYIPKRSNLEGPRYGGRRVEFNLAFSVEHGYEAFHVKLLKRHGCTSCSATVEFKSVDDSLSCTCGEMIHKDHLNEVRIEEDTDGIYQFHDCVE